jgi:CheY-like chemotaxis protein
MVGQKPLILIVDDNEDDVLLIRVAFEKAGVGSPLRSVRDGTEAIAYLNGDPPYSDRSKHPLPGLVLLDVRMPITGGFEVLKWIRNQARFAQLRVIMLTGSNEIREANSAYKLGANSFMVKPLDFLAASELSRSIEGHLRQS